AKLADALGLAGSMEAARLRYAQTEELAIELDQPRLLMAMLNNYAYTELTGGNAGRAQEVAGRLEEFAAESGFPLDPAAMDTIGALALDKRRDAAPAETHR